MTEAHTIPEAIAQDLVDPEVYADQRLHQRYRWLRTNEPFGLASQAGYDPFWVASKHADVVHISRNNTLFRNADRAITLTDRASDALIKSVTGGSPHLIRSLVHLDAPDHSKLRGLTQRWFMPGNLKKIEARVRQLARSSVTAMLAKGDRCDFVSDVALHYPLHVVMEILGVPSSDGPLMLKVTQESFAPLDPELGPRVGMEAASAQLGRALRETTSAFGKYFGEIAARRRAEPEEDIISVIANAEFDGSRLSADMEFGYYIILATAGHDTTSSSTAGAMRALCEDPDLFETLKANPQLIPAMLEEAVRWTTPVKSFMRTAAQATQIRGRAVAEGDWIMLCYASANRDEDVFPDADRFRIDRPKAEHIAFGHAVHSCLGQHLARMEMRILFEELLPRVTSLSLDGQPTMTRAVFVNGLKTLPIRMTAA